MRLAVATAPRRASFHWRQSSATWGEILGWAAEPAGRRECGNYLLGTLTETTIAHDASRPTVTCTALHRNKRAVLSRSAIALDADSPVSGFADAVPLLLPSAGLLHTTWSSTADEPRYRLLVPLTREVAPDEYVTIASALVRLLGEESFDPTTTQPERYMFRPSAHASDSYVSIEIGGAALDPEEFLAEFPSDLRALPVPKPSRWKRDPFGLDGLPGSFNRAYADAWDTLIGEYELPYESVGEGRWQLAGAHAQAGMGPINGAPGLVYSHHSSDPAYGEACSAFDLVRLHRFGHLDEDRLRKDELAGRKPLNVNRRPSHKAMLEVAATDHRVTAEVFGGDLADVDLSEIGDDPDDDPNAWRNRLKLDSSGGLKDVIANWDLVKKMDPVLGLLYYSELSMSPEVAQDLPWRKVGETSRLFSETDRFELADYIERTYHVRPTIGRLDSMIATRAGQRKVNPVKEWLSSLSWDGVERLETCLPGVVPTSYTRLVARKTLVGAVARAVDPGVKMDYSLVLQGPEGLGKSRWVETMARDWSVELGPLGHKDTLLAMRRGWIVLSDEGHTLRKADQDDLKAFLTRRVDVFRLPYDRETLPHPRHCVIWSTTNDETFLRRQEGNRRFLIVPVRSKVDPATLTDDYVSQVWAEAVSLYRAGEPLWLAETEEAEAAANREAHIEEDALGGIIEEYLDTGVPRSWEDMSPEARASWIAAYREGFEAEGPARIERVCSSNVWVEALGRPRGAWSDLERRRIFEALCRLPGWVREPGQNHVRGFAKQTTFARADDLDGLL